MNIIYKNCTQEDLEIINEFDYIFVIGKNLSFFLTSVVKNVADMNKFLTDNNCSVGIVYKINIEE